jgi:hypothetical protein
MNDRLKRYRDALDYIDKTERELWDMVSFLVKGTDYDGYTFRKLVYNATGEKSELYMDGDKDYDDTLDVPTEIFDKYFDGKKKEAKKAFEEFLDKDNEEKWEIEHKLQLEAERKRKAREAAEQKQKEMEERKLFKKLNKKYGKKETV